MIKQNEQYTHLRTCYKKWRGYWKWGYVKFSYNIVPHNIHPTDLSTAELLMKRKLTMILSRVHSHLCLYEQQMVAKEGMINMQNRECSWWWRHLQCPGKWTPCIVEKRSRPLSNACDSIKWTDNMKSFWLCL